MRPETRDKKQVRLRKRARPLSIRPPFSVRAALYRSSGWRVRYFAPVTTELWSMRLFSTIRIYERIDGLYDVSLGFWSREVRRQAAGALNLRATGFYSSPPPFTAAAMLRNESAANRLWTMRTNGGPALANRWAGRAKENTS